MDINAVATIARRGLIINIRNRWTAIFAVVFGATLVKFTGGEGVSFALIIGGLVAWMIAPFLLARRALTRQGI